MRIFTRPMAIGSLVAISALLLAACRSAGGGSAEPSSPSSPAAGALMLTVAQTDAGDALAGAGGMTLYTFANDTDGTSTCTGGCATTWPPLLGDGADVTAGDGVAGSFGTTTRDDGSQQVTHNGQPLYYYSGDSAPGDSTGDGFGGVWSIAPPTEGAAPSQAAASEGQAASPTPYVRPDY